MDFGAVTLDGLVMSCSDNHINNNASLFPTTSSHSLITNSDPDAKPKWYGSVNGGLILKQERSAAAVAAATVAAATKVDYWRDLKMAKTSGDDDFDDLSLSSKPAFLFHNNPCTNPSLLLRSNNTSLHSDGQHMLSFSSPNHSQTHFPPHTSTSTAAAYPRNTGYGCGGLNAVNMHGMLTGMKGPFTPSQWIELEHQTLIYKYLTANAPIPSHLLPICKALETATFPGPHLRHNPYGWGAFQLGFSGSSDPEPGRCRRTDGKKWRCSRDAVVDQKYCERHMNRGRHRSRKPVEGQTGHSASGGGPTAAKLMPMSSSVQAAVVATGGASNSLSHLHHHQHLNSMQSGVPNLPASSQLDRGFLNKANVSDKINENQYSILKQHNPTEESTRSEFGFVCSNSLLNPLHKNTSLINSRNYASSKETKSQNSLRQFMEHSGRTQLSISIPMAASSDFMSSTSSPTNDKLALSPLRLSRELDPTQMGLGMGTTINEANQRQANWIPISWETFMGGPLGEVLHSTNSSAGESTSKNTSPLNLMTEGWDSSPRTRMALSPTGVLQKTAFGSLSNSSAGSSPRTENNLLGSLPAM